MTPLGRSRRTFWLNSLCFSRAIHPQTCQYFEADVMPHLLYTIFFIDHGDQQHLNAAVGCHGNPGCHHSAMCVRFSKAVKLMGTLQFKGVMTPHHCLYVVNTIKLHNGNGIHTKLGKAKRSGALSIYIRSVLTHQSLENCQSDGCGRFTGKHSRP